MEQPARPPARLLRNLVEPVAGVAFFAPEVHARYERLGFDNPGRLRAAVEGVRPFDWTAYFAARAACLGDVDGSTVAAAFAVFPEARIGAAMEKAGALATADQLLAARLDGTVAALERLLVDDRRFDIAEVGWAAEVLDRGLGAASSADRPLFAGLRSLARPDTALGRWWRACDQYREHRMDVHAAALADAGIDGCQACLLNDARQGLGLGTYVKTRGWTGSEIGSAIADLQARGLLDDTGLTATGRQFREAIETTTDAGQAAVVDAIGSDIDRLQRTVGWHGPAIVDGYGYPGRRFVETASGGGTSNR